MRHKRILLYSLAALLTFGPAGCPAFDRRDLSVQTTDAKIETAIKSDLVRESPAKALNVNVYSFLGHVYLVGDVDTQYRAVAEKSARATPGVTQVTTHWFPPGTADRVSDSGIEAAIDTNLLFARNVSSSQVNVDVWGGHVVLLGLMASQADIERAIKETRGISGVKSVTSYLSVYPGPRDNPRKPGDPVPRQTT